MSASATVLMSCAAGESLDRRWQQPRGRRDFSRPAALRLRRSASAASPLVCCRLARLALGILPSARQPRRLGLSADWHRLAGDWRLCASRGMRPWVALRSRMILRSAASRGRAGQHGHRPAVHQQTLFSGSQAMKILHLDDSIWIMPSLAMEDIARRRRREQVNS